MLYATILALSTYAASGDYVLDTAQSYDDCMRNTVMHDKALYNVWGDDNAVEQWMAKFNITINPSHIEKASVECVEIQDEYIP